MSGGGKSAKKKLGAGLIAVWLAAMVAVGVTQMAKHWVPLPRIQDPARTAAAVDALREDADRGRWLALQALRRSA